MSHADDASYKTLFSSPEAVRDLILGFIPDDWLHGLDYATLERVSGSYVTEWIRAMVMRHSRNRLVLPKMRVLNVNYFLTSVTITF